MNERPKYLAMLAEEDRLAEAPRRVELALRDRVRAKQQTADPVAEVRDGWFRWRSFWAGAAMAAAAGLAVMLWTRPAPAPPAAAPAPALAAEAMKPPVVAVQGTEESAPAASVNALVAASAPAAVRAPRRASANGKGTEAREEPRRFYSISYAAPELLANAQIVRVRVPSSALLQFGLPMSAYRPNGGQVEADVIFTEDGIARAIRFVQPQTQK